MTDQPSNATDQPGELPEHPSDQPGVGQSGTAPDAAAQQPGDAVAEAPAEQPPAEVSAEVPAEPVPAQADTEQAPADEQPGDAAPETPAEQPPGDLPSEVPAEPVPAQSEADQEPAAETETAQPADDQPQAEKMNWYILKVQSNREDSIREGLLRRVAIAGLGQHFGQAIVPTENVTEFKAGKKRVSKRKLYPGYLVVQMEINDDTWFLVRETPGIGDFTGAAGHPTPMLPHEVSRILAKQEEKNEKAPKLKIGFNPGDQVKINEGTFENFEGEVDSIDQTNGQVTVMINIFGRSTPVTLEYWQIEGV